MWMFVDWQVDGQCRLWQENWLTSLFGPWCGAISHRLIWFHPFCQLIQVRCSSCVYFWTGKLMASTNLETRLVEFLMWTLVSCDLTLSYPTSSILPVNSRQVSSMCVCWWTGKLMTGTDSDRRLVQFLVQTPLWCNFTWAYTASSILEVNYYQFSTTVHLLWPYIYICNNLLTFLHVSYMYTCSFNIKSLPIKSLYFHHFP